MSNESDPGGFEPEEIEVQWVTREDGEPFDVHITRDSFGNVATSSITIFSDDRDVELRLTVPGELPSGFETRMGGLFAIMEDIQVNPEKYRTFKATRDPSEDPDPLWGFPEE